MTGTRWMQLPTPAPTGPWPDLNGKRTRNTIGPDGILERLEAKSPASHPRPAGTGPQEPSEPCSSATTAPGSTPTATESTQTRSPTGSSASSTPPPRSPPRG